MKILTIIITLIISIISYINPLTSNYDPDDYPTWQEVLDARKDETATKKKIDEIQGLLVKLEEDLNYAFEESTRLGDIYFEKQYEYDVAAWEYQEISAIAEKANTEAEEAEKTSGMFLVEMSKVGVIDLDPMRIFLNPGTTEGLLSKIGYADKVTTSLDGIFKEAIGKRNTAESLAEQAEVAKKIRETAAVEAEASFQKAQEAQILAEQVYQTHQARSYELQQQLQALTTERAMTEEKYKEGLAAKKAAEEAARKAAEEAARAAAAAGNTDGGASTGGGFSPAVTSSNWAKPTTGYISSHYGLRIHPVYGVTRFHAGTDFANRCGTAIYAASAGVVEYAGWLGTFGYFIRINHGNGLTTGYAHIQEGGIKVSIGQQISAGQYIANMGTTGTSTGCHLHFEVRDRMVPGDPIPFLRGQGVSV